MIRTHARETSKRRSYGRFVATLLALVVFATMVLSCNTVKGAGKDTESLGESIQDAAD